ncbi:hypothetical protein RF11_04603 [Thelohanellus kitauei]|uniref:Uncharacterized protein n=1 Tax=Thelohanellus kitauei TaxID=669202 RepID=A0A0C2MGL7_THEKT|nr:hypothetical protein RF11_04603 [Thelohanellus kitauei]
MAASENPEYKRYLKVLSLIIFIFDGYNYLDQNHTNTIQNLFASNSFDHQNTHGESSVTMIPTPISDTSIQTNIFEKNLLYYVLEWFIFMYEMKFIYRDISSVFDNMDNNIY